MIHYNLLTQLGEVLHLELTEEVDEYVEDYLNALFLTLGTEHLIHIVKL